MTILSDDKYRSSSVIQRIVNRVMIYLIFPLKVVVFYRRIYREDCILVVTSPFYMPLLASLLFKHTKLLILHNDLYPEGFYKIPFLNKFSFFFKAYRAIVNRLLYDVKSNIFLSESHLQSRDYINKCVIYTPAISRNIIQKTHASNQKDYAIGYIGTMGYNHSGIEFLTLLKSSKFNSHMRFIFNISGSLSGKFKSLSLDNDYYDLTKSIAISGSLDEGDYVNTMSKLDFGLILLGINGGDIVFPSKFSAHLSYGHPIILISDQDNDLHKFVESNSIGISINIFNDDLNDLNHFIDNMNYDALRENSLSTYRKYFHYEKIAKSIMNEMKLND